MATDWSDRTFGAPRFDVVLRGYDRRQVDEHISQLHRVLSRIRGDLQAARMHAAATPPHTGQGGRSQPTPRPRTDGSGPPDVVGSFTDRMQSILQAAEEEAAEIRARAKAEVKAAEERAVSSSRAAARTDEDSARTTLADLIRQRDAVLADLKRLRSQLESLLSSPTARPILAGPETPRNAERRHPGTGPSRVGPPTGPERGVVRDSRPDGVAAGDAGAPGTPGKGTPAKPGTPGTATPAKPGASPSDDLFHTRSNHRRREAQPQPPDKTATPTSTGGRTVVVGCQPGAENGAAGSTRQQPDAEARLTSPADATVKVDAAQATEGRKPGASTANSPGEGAAAVTDGSDRKPETVQSASPLDSQ
jgi:syndecan 1